MHHDEIALTDEVVRALIAGQFPGWAGAPVRRVEASGTVHAIFRVGDELAARFPLRPCDVRAAAVLLEREAEAARRFAGHSPFPAPRPVAIGGPGAGYPLPWSVQTWLPGEVAAVDIDGSVALARDLAHLIRALPRTSADVMSHGDLQPLNVLVAGGRLAGVLDTGGFAPADPALDAMAGWYFFGDAARAVFRDALGCDDLEWERGKAWSFAQALGAIWYYVETNPPMYEMGRLALDRVVANTGV